MGSSTPKDNYMFVGTFIIITGLIYSNSFSSFYESIKPFKGRADEDWSSSFKYIFKCLHFFSDYFLYCTCEMQAIFIWSIHSFDLLVKLNNNVPPQTIFKDGCKLFLCTKLIYAWLVQFPWNFMLLQYFCWVLHFVSVCSNMLWAYSTSQTGVKDCFLLIFDKKRH